MIDGPPLLRVGAREWLQRLGLVAKSIGSKEFHLELIDLFGSSIRHESCWIIRFDRAAPPDVVFTHNVPDEVVGTYNKSYSGIDPFSDHWKRNCKPGVVMLSQAAAASHGTEPYRQVFLPNARISDEMTIFLPTIGHSCLGLFLEREQGHFSRADIERAHLVFPTLEGCHRAHMGWLFNNPRNIKEMELNGLIDRPMLIKDRFGAEVYSNDAWTDAVAWDRSIPTLLDTLPQAPGSRTVLLESFVLKVEQLDSDFLLAPGGRMFVLEPHVSSAESAKNQANLSGALKMFTPRERDILSLMMKDYTTGQIAQTLEISKGTIKNYRLRLYRKAGVASERALIRKFTPAFRPA